MKEKKQRIIEHLRATDLPVHVEEIRTSCHIGNWNTALKHLLELCLTGQIQGRRTSHGWIFWVDKEVEHR